jgi:medium-chain acyl-[acyl-carrier-protein] hydrolase
MDLISVVHIIKKGKSMNNIFTKDLVIRFSETDNKGKFKVVSMFDCFQDVGSEHAAMLKISGRDLMTQNYTWVMLKYNVRIERLPIWNDPVTLKTWRYPSKNLYELREFDILDSRGNLLIKSLSSWVMMNYTSRKPVRLDRFIPTELMEGQHPVEDDFSRLDAIPEYDRELPFRVRMQDIDFNNHVNNSVYIGWAVEAVPEEIHKEYRLAQVEITYLNEISYGHIISSRIKADSHNGDAVFFHSITAGDTGTELTRLKTVWKKP